MPELPEVETIRRGLDAGLAGRTITAVDILFEKSFQAPADLVRQIVVGATIKRLDRRAKVLIIELDNDYSLLIHLKMTGQMVLVAKRQTVFAGGHPSASMMGSNLPDKSTRVIFAFDDGSKLYFNDQRKFGWIKLVPTAELGEDLLIARLGPEPMSTAFTAEGLALVLKRRKGSPIKAVILDQSTVSGVGNIYADEALHLAKIHPARLAGDLSSSEVKALHQAIKSIIGLGIEHNGTSFSNYVTVDQGKGDYLQHARVFRRQGLPCPVCGTEIIKLRVAGRGTHICPKCQVL
jgi:formamidopyrimidine-DNA glycosylase